MISCSGRPFQAGRSSERRLRGRHEALRHRRDGEAASVAVLFARWLLPDEPWSHVLAAMAVMAYVVADMPERLPRN
mgnify:CR=1 FL=1